MGSVTKMTSRVERSIVLAGQIVKARAELAALEHEFRCLLSERPPRLPQTSTSMMSRIRAFFATHPQAVLRADEVAAEMGAEAQFANVRSCLTRLAKEDHPTVERAGWGRYRAVASRGDAAPPPSVLHS